MKSLSVKQPYADYILDGKKTIETRVWNTKFRGAFLVHSSGTIIGKANLVDVISYKDDEDFLTDSQKHMVTLESLQKLGWAGRKKYGFILKDVKRISKPFAVKGRLGFFEVDYK